MLLLLRVYGRNTVRQERQPCLRYKAGSQALHINCSRKVQLHPLSVFDGLAGAGEHSRDCGVMMSRVL